METSKSGYRPDIDGIRAIAVSIVVLFHAGVAFVPSGFVGVDIFFVISGFLIGGIVTREITSGRFSFAQFYARRAKRILPPLVTVIAASALFGAIIMSAQEFRALGSTGLSALLALSNVSFWRYQDYFAPDSHLSPLLMTWSLGVEEQFYFFIPILMLGIWRFFPRLLLSTLLALTVVSFAISVWTTGHHPAFAYYLLPARAWEIGVGVVLAIWQNSSVRRSHVPDSGPWRFAREAASIFGLTAIAVAATFFDERTPFPGFVALLPVSGTLGLILAEGSFINRKILSARPTIYVGLISYSWYLWHWPMMSFLRILYLNEPPTFALMTVVPASFLMAFASWRWIEQPFRHARLPPVVTLYRYGAVVSLAAIVAVAIKLSDGLPGRLPAPARAVEEMAARGRGDCLASFDMATPDLSANCVDLKSGSDNIALIGDSHAAALGPAVRILARKKGTGIAILTKSACPPISDIVLKSSEHPALSSTCKAFINDAFERVEVDRRISTVYLAGAWGIVIGNKKYHGTREDFDAENDRYARFREGLTQSVKRLTKAGKHVIIVKDVPHLTFDPLLAALAKTIPARRYATTLALRMAGEGFPATDSDGFAPLNTRLRSIVDEVAQATKVGVLDPKKHLCSADRCTYMDNDGLYYIDTHHLSQAGALAAFGLWEAPHVADTEARRN